MSLTTDQMDRMLILQAQGITEPPAGLNDEERRVWGILLQQSAEIAERGGIVDIPGEVAEMQGDDA